MKNYRITVNGVAYDVAVEELEQGSVAAAPVAPMSAAPAPAKKAPAKASGAQGAEKVNAPMPGKIVGVKVKAGDQVSKGDVLVILEAMKMENEICAPKDGVVATVNVAVGDSVEGGDVLVSMN